MPETSPAGEPDRYQLFEAARRSAGWTVEQLWIHYLALGGSLVFFDLDAYLAGLTPLAPGQQDVLACTLNERLADLHHTTWVPYLTESDTDEDALTQLLRQLPDLYSSD
jgi:hypothetical protein